MTSLIRAVALTGALATTSGCVVAKVVETTVDVAALAVGTTVDVAVGVVDLAIPDGDDDDED